MHDSVKQTSPTDSNLHRRGRYLFIRIIEACNADCFMCGFARSTDRYRFSEEDFLTVSAKAKEIGVRYIRFTGGEPLLHKKIGQLVKIGHESNFLMSIISNGMLLPEKIDMLAAAGLTQIIVSIDGMKDEHNTFRNTKDLYEKCIEGLERAHAIGIRTRVNTVVGPHNFEQMPALQKALEGLGVEQWELSALKLGRPIRYPSPDHVKRICEPLYEPDRKDKLIPLGVRFYGESAEQQNLFFYEGITPKPSMPTCQLAGDVIYLDAKSGDGYGCSLLPHRDHSESFGGVTLKSNRNWIFDSDEWKCHVSYFKKNGPKICTGCSATAAGYSNLVNKEGAVRDWEF